ncbi:MAG: hypothetical protein M1816_007587 [Peltula sp. TS41687]|nr:MAG: hypothetical protein M1816_007587 [Peltula sp. TS41687]
MRFKPLFVIVPSLMSFLTLSVFLRSSFGGADAGGVMAVAMPLPLPLPLSLPSPSVLASVDHYPAAGGGRLTRRGSSSDSNNDGVSAAGDRDRDGEEVEEEEGEYEMNMRVLSDYWDENHERDALFGEYRGDKARYIADLDFFLRGVLRLKPRGEAERGGGRRRRRGSG